MLNEDVIDLYSRTQLGTKVVVLPMTNKGCASSDRFMPPAAPASISANNLR